MGFGLHNTNRHDTIKGPAISVSPLQAKLVDSRPSCRNAILDAIERLHRRTGASRFARCDIVAEVQAPRGSRAAARTSRQRMRRGRDPVDVEGVEQRDVGVGLQRGCGVRRQGGAQVAEAGRHDQAVAVGDVAGDVAQAGVDAAHHAVDHQARWAGPAVGVLDRPYGVDTTDESTAARRRRAARMSARKVDLRRVAAMIGGSWMVECVGGLEQPPQGGGEPRRGCAVDDRVVEAQRQWQQLTLLRFAGRRTMPPTVTITVIGDSGMPHPPASNIPSELIPTGGANRAVVAGTRPAARSASRRTTPARNSDELLEQLCEAGALAVQRGLVLASGGNLSGRMPGSDEAFVTATGTWLDRLDPGDFSVIRIGSGEVVGGAGTPSVEWKLHQRTHQERSDVNAVVHLHPQHAVLVDALGHQVRLITLDHAYYVRSVGRCPYFPAGSQEIADASAEVARDHNAIILAHHGCSAFGDSVGMAFRRAMNLEEAATATYHLLAIGNTDLEFPKGWLDKLATV